MKYAKKLTYLWILFSFLSFPTNIFATTASSMNFEYWNKYNHYTEEVIYTQDEIKQINKNNIKKSPYLYDVLSTKASSYGVIAKRTVMKQNPTSTSINPDTSNDSTALTALFPWDEVAIHEYNKDKTWAKVTCLDYKGWIKTSDIMITSKSNLISLKKKNFITITCRQMRTEHNLLLDMGTYLPLVSETETSYNVQMPVSGTKFKTYTISIDKKNATKGYLPYSQANVIRQALKFRGEAYGWGHSNSTRDCSGFIRDLYRSFGIIIARDTSTASKDIVGTAIKTSRPTESLLKKQPAGGTLLYMKGHVMLYLGVDKNNTPYIIHQFGKMKVNGKIVDVHRNDITKASTLTSSGNSFLYYVHTMIHMTKLK